MNIYDEFVLEEDIVPISEEEIEKLHKYLDEALEKCGDFYVQDFEDELDIWKWHKGWG
tara:strand:+ start:78 stop:251 length:174 start_codon:yes stop_codon:yes gene_type:complete